jgi:MFS-type transporter involved in bile tolerance (Atg22 family)
VRIAAGLLVAILEWAGSGWADVNGSNYDWWRSVLLVLALLTLVLVVVHPPRLPGAPFLAAAGLGIAAAAVVITTQRFNDSYLGTRLWPDLLACAFGAGVGVATVALSAAARPRSTPASA